MHMTDQIQNKEQLVQSLPPEHPQTAHALITQALKHLHQKIVVLDDDPTGTQTVHDIFVYTHWDPATLRQAFNDSHQMFYILTNSRSLTPAETKALHTTIAHNLVQVSQECQQDFILVSRSDSTLRGHFPLETKVLKETIEAESTKKFDGEILMPFFLEGGRYTINDIHYVLDGQQLIPAAQTEFAHDRQFGYHFSNMKDYVAEKTDGQFPADQVQSISIAAERQYDLKPLVHQLQQLQNFNKLIVNAASYADAQVAIAAIVEAMAQGKNYLFRTAAAFTKVIGNIADIPLLQRKDIADDQVTTGGLVIVGSHVQKTTEQLKALLQLPNITGIEFHTQLVLDPPQMDAEFQRVLQATETALKAGHNVVVYTSRKRLELPGNQKDEELKLSTKIASYVTKIVQELEFKPSFIIAKGGITSSDIATQGLGIQKALVGGQVAPGIPVWITGSETKFPNIAYVVFPGNVGGVQTLKDIVQQLSN